jgi:hypothetical protein
MLVEPPHTSKVFPEGARDVVGKDRARQSFHEESAGGCRQSKRHYACPLIRHRFGNVRTRVLPQHCIFLETVLARPIDPLIWTHGMGDNTISYLETCDAVAHLNNIPSHISSYNERQFNPRDHETGCSLNNPIVRIDSHSSVFHDHLVLSWGSIGRGQHLKWCNLGSQKGGLVGGNYDAVLGNDGCDYRVEQRNRVV